MAKETSDAAIISLKLESAKARLSEAKERMQNIAAKHRAAVNEVKNLERQYMSATVDVERWRTVIDFLSDKDEVSKDGSDE